MGIQLKSISGKGILELFHINRSREDMDTVDLSKGIAYKNQDMSNHNLDLRHRTTDRRPDQQRFDDGVQWATLGRQGAWYYQGQHRCRGRTTGTVWCNISTFIFAALPPHRHTDLTALTLDRTDLTPRTPSTTLIFAALTLYHTDLAARTPSTTLISPHSLSTALISQNKTIKYFSDSQWMATAKG